MNTPIPLQPNLRGSLLAVCFSLLVPGILPAQTAPVPEPTPEDDTAIVLAPFEVTTDQDHGYAAQNTTAGSRLNTSLADTPAAISVFTKDFLDDIGATSIEDITAYAVNSGNNLEDGVGASLTNSDPILTIRGLQSGGAGGGNTGRFTNFFQSSITQDTFNFDRAELSRGPNSVLFGVGSAAGGFNVGTKKADVKRDKYAVSFRVGSWEQTRATLDVNQAIIPGKVGLRVNALVEDSREWRPYLFNKQERYQFNLRWQIAPQTRFDIEYEVGHREYANGPRGGVLDALTPWIAAGSALDTQVGRPFPANVGIQLLTTAVVPVFDTASGTIYDARNQSVSSPAGGTAGVAAVAGEENPNIFDFDLVPRDVFLGGAGYGTSNDYDRLNATLSHEIITNLFVEAAFNREVVENHARDTLASGNRILVDTNAFLPDGTANPHAGETYVEQYITLRDRDSSATDFRLSTSYDLDLTQRDAGILGSLLGHHRFAALYLHRDKDQQDNQQQEVNIDSPNNTSIPHNNANRVPRRTYVDLDGPVEAIALADFRTQPISGVTNVTNGRSVSTMFVPFGQPRDTRDLTDTNLFVWQGSFLQDRLVGTVGYREDRVATRQSTAVTGDAFGPFSQGILYPMPNDYYDHSSGITRTQGLVAKPLSWLSLFYNRSSSFDVPPRTIQIFPGEFAPSSTGQTNDYGVKFALLQNRLFATITRYETIVNDGAANGAVGAYVTALNSIWTTLDAAGVAEAAGVSVFSNGRTFDRVATGTEFELTANPSRNLRLVFNYSSNKTVDSNEAIELINYFAAQNATFTSGDRGRLVLNGAPGELAASAMDPNDGVTTIAEQIAASAANIDEAFVRPNGVRQLGQPIDQANLRATYSFSEGRLRGFGVGGGVRWRGERVLAYTSSDPATREAIQGDPTTTVDGNLTYRRKVDLFGRKCDLRLQLNVNNLLDDDDLIINRVYEDGTPRTFSLPVPRQWFVTTTLEF